MIKECEDIKMKKYLLPQGGSFYKANLHCHTTFSDGVRTPQEIKDEYMEKGYSVVAFTDHDVLIPHHDLTDDKFVALTGFEVEINEPKNTDFDHIKTCHICFVALDKDNETQFCYNRTANLTPKQQHLREIIKFDESKPDYVRRYTPEGVCEMMRKGRENGFFVTYNHPKWSLENYGQYMQYHGMHAMEICNYSSCCMGYDENNGGVYDDILRGGERIFCIGTDDNHNRGVKGSRGYDACGAYIMIKAEKLEYSAITDALVKGDFYTSRGPEIHELYFEDGFIHIKCSSADRICATYGMRRARAVYDENGDGICEASFKIEPDTGYVRLTVYDKKGDYAATNAYFCDELFGNESGFRE